MNYKLSDLPDFEAWLINRGLGESSVYQYMQAVKKYLLSPNANEEDIETYNEFILEFAIKKRSLYYYDALKIFLKYLYKDNSIKKNQMIRQLLKPNKNNDTIRTRKVLDDETREQVIKLIKDYKHRIIARIQNETGVRGGDVIKLKRGSIGYEAYGEQAVMRIDFVGKGSKHFVKYIFDENIQNQIHLFITSNILDDEYYFLERDKGNEGSSFTTLYRTNYHHFWSDLKQAIDMLGYDFKDFSTHDFRRAFARKVWSKTHDVVLLKESLNHERLDTTLLYLKNSGMRVQDLQKELYDDKNKTN